MDPLPQPVVIVVGSVNTDLVIRAPALPRPGETVTGGRFARAQGGKGANQAAAAARLGARTVLAAAVGDDEFGREALADLVARGVDVSCVGLSRAATGVALIVVDERGENQIAVAPGANAQVGAELVERALEVAVLAPAGSTVVSPAGRGGGVGPVVLASLEVGDGAIVAAARGARARGLGFVLNPAPARRLPAEVLAACDVLTPNEGEAAALGGVETLLAAGAGAVLVTRGARGAELHLRGEAILPIPAFPVEPVDTTGAGDAFNGALAWALAGGRSLEEAAILAAAAGALATRGLGARGALPERAEVEALAGLG